MLHVYALLVVPLGVGHTAQPDTGQHESGGTVHETARHTGAAADLPVQPLKTIVRADARPVFAGKIAVSSVSSMPSSTFLAASFSFIERRPSTTALAFSRAAFLLS